MRFSDLEGRTSLPLERLRARFRHEEVLTVLPVSGDVTGRDYLLVATSMKLAIVIVDASHASDDWMTHWAPWDAVRLADDAEPVPESDRDEYRLTVHVGGLTFHARSRGDDGQRVLRDFVVAAQARREALSPTP